jgi:hypothetical protein
VNKFGKEKDIIEIPIYDGLLSPIDLRESN